MGTSYDEIQYPGRPRTQAHPSRLATMGTLAGMTPPAVERARVLEVGCGDAAHLIPLAELYPEARFVGIDLAQAHIEEGRAIAEELGLRNLELHTADLMDFADHGEFDYIIAHGFFSWVPPAVQDKLLEICRAQLSPMGVAFISYNTMPGGHIRMMLRDMMLVHAEGAATPLESARRGVEIVRAVADLQPQNSALRPLLQEELQRLNGLQPSFLLHDDLGEVNMPFYFTEFVARAGRHGLQFLSEAEFSGLQDQRFPSDALQKMYALAGDDYFRREQYRDFLRTRRFRQSLVCRANVTLDRSGTADRIRQLYVGSPLVPTTKVDLAPGVDMKFAGDEDTSLTVDQPLIKGALLALTEAWPGSLSFEALVERAREIAEVSTPLDEEGIASLLWKMCGVRFMFLESAPWRFATAVSERPRVTALARLQARDGTLITTLRHYSIEMREDLPRQFLSLLDGTRDVPALAADLWTQTGKTISEEDIAMNLYEFLRLALLVE